MYETFDGICKCGESLLFLVHDSHFLKTAYYCQSCGSACIDHESENFVEWFCLIDLK